MIVLKTALGLDPDDVLARLLGPTFRVIEHDDAQPLLEQVTDVDVFHLIAFDEVLAETDYLSILSAENIRRVAARGPPLRIVEGT